jgi:hypothetical protein
VLAVPASSLASVEPDAFFWLSPEEGYATPSLAEVTDTLTYCYSSPSFPFHVQHAGRWVFSMAPSCANIAKVIVATGRCRRGGVSLLLFSSSTLAIAGGRRSRGRKPEQSGDVTSPPEFQTGVCGEAGQAACEQATRPRC